MATRMAIVVALCLVISVGYWSRVQAEQESILVQVLGSKYTMLVKLLEEADLLGDLESDESFGDGVTIFAPSDLYLTEKVSPGLLTFLEQPSNTKLLRQVLLNHIVRGKLTARSWYPGETVKTFADGDARLYLEGGELKVSGAVVKEIGVLEAEDGVVHSISGFLVPDEVEDAAHAYLKDLTEEVSERRVLQDSTPVMLAPAPAPSAATPSFDELIAQLAAFDSLLNLINSNSMVSTLIATLLSEGGNFTLLAPTNAAFTAAGSVLGTLDNNTVAEVLFYHIVKGEYNFADLEKIVAPSSSSRRLLQTASLETYANDTVAVTSSAGAVYVDGVKVSQPDLLGSSMTVQALGIDGVLIPSSVTVPPSSPPPPPPSPPPPPPSAGAKSGASSILVPVSMLLAAMFFL